MPLSARRVFAIQIAVLVALGVAHVALKCAAFAGAPPPAAALRLFDLDGDTRAEIVYHSGRGPFDSGIDRGALVIVEVKARNTYDAGSYAVTPTAQQRIARAAQTLAGRWRLMSAPIRFDLVVVGSGLLPRHERGAWYDERSRA